MHAPMYAGASPEAQVRYLMKLENVRHRAMEDLRILKEELAEENHKLRIELYESRKECGYLWEQLKHMSPPPPPSPQSPRQRGHFFGKLFRRKSRTVGT